QATGVGRLGVERGARLLECGSHGAERQAVAQLALRTLAVALFCRLVTGHWILAPAKARGCTSRSPGVSSSARSAAPAAVRGKSHSRPVGLTARVTFLTHF